ncbi:hypothetical protein RCL1_003212 [Eukaryota sp. TZLM3-RCL]
MKLTPLFLVLCLLCISVSAQRHRKVLLQDIDSLTFQEDSYTSARRTSPIPQLNCVGGRARRTKFHPHSVICKNEGFDGVDVTWKCSADLPSEVRLGKVTVSCEGYEYPEDPYVLVGSCGLEYTLEYTNTGRSPTFSHSQQPSSVSPNKILSCVVFLGIFMVLFCVCCSKRPGVPPMYPDVHADAPPHVPYNQYPDQPPVYRAPPPQGYTPPGTNYCAPPVIRQQGPGFWTGALTGWTLGRSTRSRSSRPSFGSSSRSSFGSSGGSSIRTSSSFGGTRRR